MIRALARFRGVVLVLLASCQAGIASADVDIKPLVSSSVRVLCTMPNGGLMTGSGFLVGKNGKFALTNSHVVTGCRELVVMSPRDSGDAKMTAAKVRWNSKTSMSKRHLDAALLALEESVDRPGVGFATRNTVTTRDSVITVGYPSAADNVGTFESLVRPSITQGNISRILIRKPDGEGASGSGVGLYQITASIGPGNSGGPLFNEYGEVIGINTEKSLISAATITEQGDVGMVRVPLQDGVAWSQEIDDLLPILAENGIAYQVTAERRNWFWSWINREPVTAGALASLLALLIFTIAVMLVRRPWSLSPQPAGGGGAAASTPAPAPRAAGDAYVLGVAGPYSGNRFPLQSDLVFGRDPKSCNVVFPGDQDGISSRHCSLRFDASASSFELRDLGSANGTFVDGKRIQPGAASRLRDGDEFYLFKSKYRFAVRTGSSEHAGARTLHRG